MNRDVRPLVVSGSDEGVADGDGVIPGQCLRLVHALACVFVRKIDLGDPMIADGLDELIAERAEDNGEMLTRLTEHMGIN